MALEDAKTTLSARGAAGGFLDVDADGNARATQTVDLYEVVR